jgi:glycosyltransferase involved in cell wall biosynthesis
LKGAPLQDFGLGPGADQLVHPGERRIERPPGEIEACLAELARGLTALHAIGVVHGDPALMNAYVTSGETGIKTGVWVDLNSVAEASDASVNVDIAGFLVFTVVPALVDATFSSPGLVEEVVRIWLGPEPSLTALADVLSRPRSDHLSGSARPRFHQAIRSELGGDVAGRRTTVMQMSSFAAPLYFLDQTKSDLNSRFFSSLLDAERARAVLLEEERTRVHYLRFSQQIEELTQQLQSARADLINDKARIMAEARLADARQSLAVVEARADEFRSESERLRADLDAIYRSRAWRLIGTLRQGKKAVTGLVRLPQRVFGSNRPGSIAGSETGTSSIGPTRPSLAPLATSYPVTVSVIMPVYNKGRDLLAAIDSVLHQTLRSVEVVVWDDGSTDVATLDALEEAAALDRVTVFRATNQGVISARNAAMAYARGRYFMCLDPDDAIHPTYLEKAVTLLENDPSTAIAYPWQRSVGDKAEIWETRDLDPRLIVEVNHVPVCSVFRREVFLETGGFSDVMAGGYEDWEFWAHAAELGFRGRVIPEPLFIYSHSQSKDESRDASAREMHLALATEIGKLHPLLVGKRAIPRRHSVITSDDPGWASREIAFPRGSGVPILLFLPWFTVGGADTVVERLLSQWRDQGRTVVVCTTTDLAPGMVDRSLDLFDYTPFVYQLRRLLPERSWVGFVAGIVGALGNPTVFNVGAAWFYEFADTLRELHPGVTVVDQQFNDMGHADGNRAASHAIDVTVVAYQRLAEVFLEDGRPPNSVEVVYTGIATPDRPPSSERERVRSELGVVTGEKLVAFVGRFSAEKRPSWIPEVADALGDGYRLVIVGDGPLAEEMAADLENRPRLNWLRRTDSIDGILTAADVVMIPSEVEGIPLVALEALALGTPVVATAVGGLPELAGTPGVSLVGMDDLGGFVAAIQAAAGGGREGPIELPDRFQATFMAQRYDEVLSR